MAGFGGAIKLTGESEYRRALSSITSSLKVTASEMKVVATQFSKSDTSTQALAAKTEVLNKRLSEEQQKYSTLQKQLASFAAQQKKNEEAHSQLESQLNKEKKTLAEVEAQYGKNSKEYKEQKKVVEDLEAAVKKSSQTNEANEKTIKKTEVALNNAQAEMNKTENELRDLEDAANDSAKAAQNAANGGFTVFKGMLADLASRAITSAINGLKRLGSALIDVGKQSIQSYAQYEQLVGGVDTLFKESSKEVQNYAAVAYKTAGMSANTYMETVTSFSASLLQGLGGDTAKAAKIADMAIIDMSDNANKMGTSMELIQNAYQGFAKQNFTMLDNLKLGYGGTQAEMARLINDTGVMGDKFKATAQNIREVPFDKMIEAIHKVQQNMGITGTTALEASETIEGSVNSMKAAWSNLLTAIADDNADLSKSVNEFVDSAITAGKNIVPRVKQIVEGIKKLIGSLTTEVFPKLKKEVPELTPLIEGFEWIIKNKDLIINALKLIIAAFAVSKIVSFTKSITEAATGIGTLAAKAVTGAKSILGVGTATQSVAKATTTATTSTGLFGKAIGVLTTGALTPYIAVAGAAVGAIALVAATYSRSTTEVEKNAKATNELRKEQQEFTKSLEESTKARKENVESANDELNNTNNLIARLDNLSRVEHKSNGQKEEMKRLVDQLNSVLPELNLRYDEQKDKLDKSTEAIYANRDAQLKLNKARAEEENAASITNDITKAQEGLAKALEQNAKNEEAYAKAKKERTEFEEKYTLQQLAANIGLRTHLENLIKTEEKAKKTYEASSEAVKNYTGSVDNLTQAQKDAQKAAETYAKQANVAEALSSLSEQAKKAGREIPLSIVEGCESLWYVVPENMEQLNKLIEFDNAIKAAKLAGQQIPEWISQGLLEGKYSVDEAMKKVREVVTLADKIETAYNEGKVISETLAQGLRDGSVSYKEAAKELELATQYEQLVSQALKTGVAIPTNLAQGVRDNTITIQEAIQQVKDATSFSELVAKATEAGFEIPTEMAAAIQSGELAPNEALQRMQTLMDYSKSITDAGLSGADVPQEFSNAILSGEWSVRDSSDVMNTWIDFQKATKTAEKGGLDVPTDFINTLLGQAGTAKNAVDQMNNWIQFTGALKTADTSGNEVPLGLAKSILSGKATPEKAAKDVEKGICKELDYLEKDAKTSGKNTIKGLKDGLSSSSENNSLKNQSKKVGSDSILNPLNTSLGIHSPSTKAREAGQYFLQGLRNGVNSGSERNSIFSSIVSLGRSMLAKMKASLQEKSPSKATQEMGQFLLQGLGIGMKDEESSILDQVETFSESVIDAMNEGLATGLDTSAISDITSAIPTNLATSFKVGDTSAAQTSELTNLAMVSAFKQALSEMKIEMDDYEMGKFVDKTVSRAIYS